MKKYLNKNKLKIFLSLVTLLVGLVIPFSNTHSQNKTEYYKKIFKNELGFKIYNDDKSENDIGSYLESGITDKYYLMLSSSISQIKESGVDIEDYLSSSGKKIILICDDSYSNGYPLSFTCDQSEVISNRYVILGKILRSNESVDEDLYVIPEDFLLSPDRRDQFLAYLKAIRRSDKSGEVSEDTQVQKQDVSSLEKLKNFSKTTTFEFFANAATMFGLVILTSGFIRFISGEKRKITFSLIKQKFSLENLSPYQKILLFILTIMFFTFIPFLITLGIKDRQGLNIGYSISYLIDSLNVKNLIQYAESGSYFRIIIFTYEVVFMILLFLFLLPSILRTSSIGGLKIFRTPIKRNIYKYALPSIAILSLTAVSLFELSAFFGTLVFLILLMIFFFVKNQIDDSFHFQYSKNEKRIFITISLVILVAGFLIKLLESGVEHERKYEDLLGVTDEVVLLPYSKDIGREVLLNEYNFKGLEPIFVDHYLIYSPNHTRIENINALEFENTGSYYIQNGNLEDIVNAIYSNNSLSEVLISSSPSNFFRVDNISDILTKEDLQIEITFSCLRQKLGTDKIKVDYYYQNNDGEIENDSDDLMYFPGCLEIGKPETYTVDIDIPFIESKYFFVRLVDVLSTDIKDIKITAPGETIRPVYFSKGSGYEVIYSGGMTTSALVPIKNYIFGDSYNLSFDMTFNEEGKFDLSVPLNELLINGVLKDRFLIWSTKKYLPVRFSD